MAGKKSASARAALDRERIAATAMEVIDEVGVEKLTMRAVAARLDVSAMALYHHVEDKDELLRLVGDDVLGHIELPDPDSGDSARVVHIDLDGGRRRVARGAWSEFGAAVVKDASQRPAAL